MTIEVVIPQKHHGNIMGAKGCKIQEITRQFNVNIKLPERGECGVVWCGVVWCGVVWCGVGAVLLVGCGVVWCCVVWLVRFVVVGVVWSC